MVAFRNRLLAGMSEPDLALIRSALPPCLLHRDDRLDRPNEPIEHIYFPESGIASVIALDHKGRGIEVGPFGREGMSGLPVVRGARMSLQETVAQVDGTGPRMSVDALECAIRE